MKRVELTFLDSLKFNRKDKEEVFFLGYRRWQHVLLEHSTIWTFWYSCLSVHFQFQLSLQVFLLLHLSFIHGESDHVSYMTDKSSCPICKVKSCIGSSLCRAHCSRIYPYIWSISSSHHCPIWYYLCIPSFIQFLVTLVIHWRIYFLPHHNMVSHQHFLKMNT